MSSPSRFAIAAAVIALLFSTQSVPAQTALPPAGAAPGQSVGFDQFKAQQLQQLQRAQARLTQQLGSPSLSPDQQQRLARRQAQLAKFAALPPDQQDQVLHRRFDRMDANRDGMIDRAELQAFRQQQRERVAAKKNAAAAPGGSNNDDFWPSQGQN